MTNVCNAGIGYTQFSNTENTFLLDYFVATLMQCNLPQNENFESWYFGGLFSQNTPSIFTYEVSLVLDGSGRAMLLITAPNGNYAQYFSTNLATKSFNQNAFSISPNPASDCISIHSKNQTVEKISIEIYDSLGKLCLSEIILSDKAFNVQQLSQGIYFLKASIGNKTTTQKLIKL